MSDLVGKTLGQFRVEAVIGQGGMGVVYRAVDEQLRRTVALKVLPPDFAADPERRARFLREARSAAAVSHANIAAIHQVGEADGRLYLAMEHVTGRTLREVLAGGPLTVEQVIPVARGLLRGIARAHEKGVVHRDLKPDNVMIDDDGEAKILDFGIAKIAAAEAPASRGRSRSMALTRAGYVVGTPGYMSPEQGAARTVDARTDVFSFGVVLFEMLTGRLPFGGATPVDMLVRATTDPPDVASRHNPGVGPALDAVIRKCLEKAPEARWQTAREVLAALDAAVPSASGPQLPLPRAAAPSPASAHSSPDALAATVALAPPLGILDVP